MGDGAASMPPVSRPRDSLPLMSLAENHQLLSMGEYDVVLRDGHSMIAHWSMSTFTMPRFVASASKFHRPWCMRLGHEKTVVGMRFPGFLPCLACWLPTGAPRMSTLDASEMLFANAYVPAGK